MTPQRPRRPHPCGTTTASESRSADRSSGRRINVHVDRRTLQGIELVQHIEQCSARAAAERLIDLGAKFRALLDEPGVELMMRPHGTSELERVVILV